MSKITIKRNQGIQSVIAEARNIEKNPNTVAFFLDNGIVRVTPKDGEWDSEDLKTLFTMAGFPRYGDLAGSDPHFPKRYDIGDYALQVVWWDEDIERCAVIHKSIWELTK